MCLWQNWWYHRNKTKSCIGILWINRKKSILLSIFKCSLATFWNWFSKIQEHIQKTHLFEQSLALQTRRPWRHPTSCPSQWKTATVTPSFLSTSAVCLAFVWVIYSSEVMFIYLFIHLFVLIGSGVRKMKFYSGHLSETSCHGLEILTAWPISAVVKRRKKDISALCFGCLGVMCYQQLKTIRLQNYQYMQQRVKWQYTQLLKILIKAKCENLYMT